MDKDEIRNKIDYADIHSAITEALRIVAEGKASVENVADALFEYLEEN